MTTFKPFNGDDAVRQRNALLSWFALDSGIETLVFGHPPAPDDLSAELDIVYYPECDWNNTGMPTISEAFDIGQKAGKNDLLAFVNGDIVFGADFARALRRLPLDRFLAVGQRWDSNYLAPIGSATPGGVETFFAEATRQGRLRGEGALDYFVSRRGTFKNLPALVPGGKLWDNYMVHHCRKQNIPVVDLTPDILVIHQNHEYKLASTGKRMMDDGPATLNNLAIGQAETPYCCVITPGTTNDASHVLKDGRLRQFWLCPGHLWYQSKKSANRICHTIGLYPFIMKIRRREENQEA